jgi:hypothetical protein
MRKSRFAITGFLVLTGALGCSDFLKAPNENNPDRAIVFKRPADVQALIGNAYIQVHQASHGGNDALQPQFLNMALESYSELGNFGMGIRSGIPRLAISNAKNNQTSVGNYRDFSGLSRAARTTALAVAKFSDPKFSVGDPKADARNRAFGWFGLGAALGNLALSYDSATVIWPTDTFPFIPPIAHHSEVMTAALAALDSAITIAKAGIADVDKGWLMNAAEPAKWDGASLVKLARSYKARFRAGVARTPAERAAVNWAEVIDDAINGIDVDFRPVIDRSLGYDMLPGQWYIYDTWHLMPTPYIGMADSSGGYDTWLSTAMGDRKPFLILTADKRFPSGNTRSAQNDASSAAGVYFRNRAPGNDRPAQGWAQSYYDFTRLLSFFSPNDRRGPYPIVTKAEIDLLAAEGYIRLGDIPKAAALIDKTRTKNGLPALTGAVATATDPVPGGKGCVPRVPQAPSFTSTACGNIMEAMKWEKRMETAFTGYGQWFFDSRGWGDLPVGTPLEFPVPYQEGEVRESANPYYNIGGVGKPGGAAMGTYGFF